VAVIGDFALLEQVDQRVLVDQPAGKADAFVKVHEMR
jgi:hypothetical protein